MDGFGKGIAGAYDIDALEAVVSFDSEGRFIGFGQGGAAAFTLTLTPLDAQNVFEQGGEAEGFVQQASDDDDDAMEEDEEEDEDEDEDEDEEEDEDQDEDGSDDEDADDDFDASFVFEGDNEQDGLDDDKTSPEPTSTQASNKKNPAKS